MGFFKDLVSLFVAKKAIAQNPLYEIVFHHVRTEIQESPHQLIQKLSAEHKENIIQDICNVADTIWQAPDRILSNRKNLLECLLEQVDYEILLVEPGNELTSFEGVSGELKDFLSDFAQKRIDSGNFVWRQETKPTKDEAYNLVWGRWWRANFNSTILNGVRIYLKDFNANLGRDWFDPLKYSLATFAEYSFRKEYGLNQIIEGVRVLQYTTFPDIVLQGHQDPLVEWEKTYNKGFPMSFKNPR